MIRECVAIARRWLGGTLGAAGLILSIPSMILFRLSEWVLDPVDRDPRPRTFRRGTFDEPR